MDLANSVQRQYVVRVARCAAQLNNAPLGLSLMHSIQELRKWYELSYHDASTLPPVSDRAGLIEFTKLLRRIFVRHLNTAALLSKGLSELAARDEWTSEQVLTSSFLESFSELEATVSSFCDARIRLRFLVVHMQNVLSNFLKDELEQVDWCKQDFLGHGPATFRGSVCLEASLLSCTQQAVRSVQSELPSDISTCISISVVGDESATFVGVPSLVTEMIAALVSEAVSPRNRETPPAQNTITVSVVQNQRSSEFAVQVCDRAGGMPLRELAPRQTFLGSVIGSRSPVFSAARWHQPLALPYAAAVARAFGGCVSSATVESHGTDRVLHIPRHGFAELKI
jgi:pyruvate dehydrogenase kinase 2/3/4